MCILLLKKKYTILTGLCLVWEIFLMSDRALAEDKRENSRIIRKPFRLPTISLNFWTNINYWVEILLYSLKI